MTRDTLRAGLIASVKIAQKDLGLDDATYRSLLQAVTGQSSAARCTVPQLKAMLAELRAKGWTPRPRNVPQELRPLHAKITALCASLIIVHCKRGKSLCRGLHHGLVRYSCYFFFLLMAVGVDISLRRALGFALPVTDVFMAYLVLTDCASIIGHLVWLGVPVPPLLVVLVTGGRTRLEKTVEDAVEGRPRPPYRPLDRPSYREDVAPPFRAGQPLDDLFMDTPQAPHSASLKAACRAAYIDNMPLTQIAKAQNVPLATLRSWKRRALEQGDDWDKLRAANLLAGEGMEAVARQTLSDYVLQHKALMGEIIEAQDMTAREKTQALASLADSFNKMVSASRRVLPETNELSVALRVIQMLTEFVRRQFPQHAAALLEVLEPFADEVAEKLGGHRG